ncbi:hypothetical protein QQ045_014703 [Rhodiola kirilowii]
MTVSGFRRFLYSLKEQVWRLQFRRSHRVVFPSAAMLLRVTALNSLGRKIDRLHLILEREREREMKKCGNHNSMASIVFSLCMLFLACSYNQADGFRPLKNQLPAATSSTSYSIEEYFIMNLAYSGPSRRGRGH